MGQKKLEIRNKIMFKFLANYICAQFLVSYAMLIFLIIIGYYDLGAVLHSNTYRILYPFIVTALTAKMCIWDYAAERRKHCEQ